MGQGTPVNGAQGTPGVGTYKIQICRTPDTTISYYSSCVYGNAPFSIVAASSGVGQYYSTGQTANVLESMKIILDQIQEAINKLKN